MNSSDSIGVTPATHIMPQQQTITIDEWRQKYWFGSLQMVTVVNPKPEAWNFMVEMRHYTIAAGTHERFPGSIANVYLDQMSKILAQDDDRLGFMTDPNLMRIYYDQLIIDVEDLVQQATNVPAYMRAIPQAQQPQPERAPWDASVGERASDIAINVPVLPPFPDAKQPEPPPAERESNFEQDGSNYKLVIAKTGLKMYYQDGKRINAAEYNKAASML